MWWSKEASMGRPFVAQRGWGGDGLTSPVVSEFSSEEVVKDACRNAVTRWREAAARVEALSDEHPFATPIIVQHEKLELQRLLSTESLDSMITLPLTDPLSLSMPVPSALQPSIPTTLPPISLVSALLLTPPATPDSKASPPPSSLPPPRRYSKSSSTPSQKSFFSGLISIFSSPKRPSSLAKDKAKGRKAKQEENGSKKLSSFERKLESATASACMT
jgi:hypothetical protein